MTEDACFPEDKSVKFTLTFKCKVFTSRLLMHRFPSGASVNPHVFSFFFLKLKLFIFKFNKKLYSNLKLMFSIDIYFILKCSLILLWQSWVFSMISLQSSVSHDLSWWEIILISWLAVQETVIIIVNAENSCAPYICFHDSLSNSSSLKKKFKLKL